MKRFFAFGCSWTLYHWPTWADIVGQNFDQYYNYGQSGAGNRFIFERLIEADLRHNFNEDDLIIIMWSTHLRHDFYKDHKWHTGGLVTNAPKYFNKEYIIKYVDTRGCIMHSMNYIAAAQRILDSKPSTYYMTSIVDLKEEGNLGFEIYDNVYTHNSWINPPVWQYMSQYAEKDYWWLWKTDPKNVDIHPTADMYMDWVLDLSKQHDSIVVTPYAKHKVNAWKEKFGTYHDNYHDGHRWLETNGVRNDIPPYL